MVEAFIHQAADYLGADAWLVTSAMSLAVWVAMKTSLRVVVGAVTGRWLPVGDLAVAILNHMTSASDWAVSGGKDQFVKKGKLNVDVSDGDVWVDGVLVKQQLNRHERRMIVRRAKQIRKAITVANGLAAREQAIRVL